MKKDYRHPKFRAIELNMVDMLAQSLTQDPGKGARWLMFDDTFGEAIGVTEGATDGSDVAAKSARAFEEW